MTGFDGAHQDGRHFTMHLCLHVRDIAQKPGPFSFARAENGPVFTTSVSHIAAFSGEKCRGQQVLTDLLTRSAVYHTGRCDLILSRSILSVGQLGEKRRGPRAAQRAATSVATAAKQWTCLYHNRLAYSRVHRRAVLGPLRCAPGLSPPSATARSARPQPTPSPRSPAPADQHRQTRPPAAGWQNECTERMHGTIGREEEAGGGRESSAAAVSVASAEDRCWQSGRGGRPQRRPAGRLDRVASSLWWSQCGCMSGADACVRFCRKTGGSGPQSEAIRAIVLEDSPYLMHGPDEAMDWSGGQSVLDNCPLRRRTRQSRIISLVQRVVPCGRPAARSWPVSKPCQGGGCSASAAMSDKPQRRTAWSREKVETRNCAGGRKRLLLLQMPAEQLGHLRQLTEGRGCSCSRCQSHLEEVAAFPMENPYCSCKLTRRR